MDFFIKDNVLLLYTGSQEDVVVPNGVTKIGSGAFLAGELRSIVIPDGVKSIGKSAFLFAISLASVALPKDLTEVGERAFYTCSALTELVLPDGVNKIGKNAFAGCESLVRIGLPAALEEIAETTFEGCTSLKSVVIPGGVKEIKSGAFRGCTSLESVIIPDSVKKIGSGAFCGCTALTSAEVPDGVEFAPDSFENTPLQARFDALREERERTIRAIKERPRRHLSEEEVRALGNILIENNRLVTGLRFCSGSRPLSGGMHRDTVTEVDRLVPLSFLAGKPPFEEFGMCVRAVVDDIVYLTAGLGERANVYSFNEDGEYLGESGAYDTYIFRRISPVCDG